MVLHNSEATEEIRSLCKTVKRNGDKRAGSTTKQSIINKDSFLSFSLFIHPKHKNIRCPVPQISNRYCFKNSCNLSVSVERRCGFEDNEDLS